MAELLISPRTAYKLQESPPGTKYQSHVHTPAALEELEVIGVLGHLAYTNDKFIFGQLLACGQEGHREEGSSSSLRVEGSAPAIPVP